MPDPMTGYYEGPPRAERVEVITPHRALGYRSPREFIARSTPEGLSGN